MFYSLVAITLHRNNLTGEMPWEICENINDYTADCYGDIPINCTCCRVDDDEALNQCY